MKIASQPAHKPDGWEPIIGDRINYQGAEVEVLSAGTRPPGHRVFWLKVIEPRGNLATGTEFEAGLRNLSPLG